MWWNDVCTYLVRRDIRSKLGRPMPGMAMRRVRIHGLLGEIGYLAIQQGAIRLHCTPFPRSFSPQSLHFSVPGIHLATSMAFLAWFH